MTQTCRPRPVMAVDYRVQNVPENYLKTSLLGCVAGCVFRDENFVNFEFLDGQFCKEEPSLVH